MHPLHHVRSALYLPASNPRAVAKARTLPCDLVILDLEDAVAPADKPAARAAALAAVAAGWPGQLVAIRINPAGTPWHDDDMAALAAAPAPPDYVVVPKAEEMWALASLIGRLPCSALAMIESPAAVRQARDIAHVPEVCGLIAGANDLAAALRLPADAGRAGLALAHQAILLAAREEGRAAFDGVYNRLDDPAGFEADARAGRALGYDGKTLIHPSQVDPANRIFAPSPEELEDAEALIAAARGGAARFRGRMVEALHVAAARRTLARADPPRHGEGDHRAAMVEGPLR